MAINRLLLDKLYEARHEALEDYRSNINNQPDDEEDEKVFKALAYEKTELCRLLDDIIDLYLGGYDDSER